MTPPPRDQDDPAAFAALYEVIVRLRAPDGCPWDREQTPVSLRGDLIEETYECVEAIDEKNPAHIKEELGDLYLLVTMLSYMHQQEGLFTVEDVLRGIAEKLIRRHPHVFGGQSARDSSEVLENWARIKVEEEGRKPRDSVLDQVSRGLPPLDRAFRLQKKAAAVGFDWPDLEGVLAKIREELGEVQAAIEAAGEMSRGDGRAPEGPAASGGEEGAGPPEASGGEASGPPRGGEALEGELGDLLFSAVNLCRYLKVDPSVALQRANLKFQRRFNHVEQRMRESGRQMAPGQLALMDRYWEEAKKTEDPL
jgi:tetrapyrrole methylase family protein/MazG family protein